MLSPAVFILTCTQLFSFYLMTSSNSHFLSTGRVNPVSSIWTVSLVQGFFSRLNDTVGGCSFVMQLAMTDPTVVGSYGAPSNVTIEYTLPGTGGALVDISLIWTGKTPTRYAIVTGWVGVIAISVPLSRKAGIKQSKPRHPCHCMLTRLRFCGLCPFHHNDHLLLVSTYY